MKWFLSADQWSQTYYELREGKLYFVENDNKEQQSSEKEVDIAAFIRDYATTQAAPYPELVAILLCAAARNAASSADGS